MKVWVLSLMLLSPFAKVDLNVDTSRLSAGDKAALSKLLEAARAVDDIFLTQYWSGNHKLLSELRKDTSPAGKERLEKFMLFKGPWDPLEEHKAFLPGVPAKKLPGANFYPENMTKAEFEAWPEHKQAEDFFSVVRRDPSGKLRAVPYNEEYKEQLTRMSNLLKEAAKLTDNESLRKFLNLRAAAFLSNDYYESDVAWMDLDAPLDVTIGPYETYNDEIFGYKASFEAYVTLRDDAETKKVGFFSDHLQEIEDNLPLAPQYRNRKIGASAPIRVVNEVLSTGDAAHGVRTAAFNLPNDERVIRAKGSKRVMLKNVQEAKFKAILEPIASRVLPKAAQKDLSFDSFFTHILAHELTHGIGPHTVKVNGAESSPRMQLKELYSAVEEAKADICGLFMLQYMIDKKMLPGAGPDTAQKMYTTFLASSFRTLRFGITEAHGRGMAVQFNYLLDKGAFVHNSDGTYRVDMAKMPGAVRDLARDLLTMEAVGDYKAAKEMLDKLAVIRPDMKASLEKLKDLPTDINPNHVSAR
ncbi:MAG: hypothetical protein SGI92_00150 [Bryobacteraceae bacterium]|nr:hypothetical protein [Bryobacteraceae bacterium]